MATITNTYRDCGKQRNILHSFCMCRSSSGRADVEDLAQITLALTYSLRYLLNERMDADTQGGPVKYIFLSCVLFHTLKFILNFCSGLSAVPAGGRSPWALGGPASKPKETTFFTFPASCGLHFELYVSRPPVSNCRWCLFHGGSWAQSSARG